ncbi:hypothetical protein, conserved [Plasmodium gonderi]|uniref:Uncharacterized protein n=1 Tax=Plasmodium gonderi TaxID=77519 RepID=A0A1Y1JKD5_PLAGO|nr:hypothetical protein, conserved [Plasmodium gonderi]GAW82996.1 hypothetical protein, conserved [Plasmodium gonderi]
METFREFSWEDENLDKIYLNDNNCKKCKCTNKRRELETCLDAVGKGDEYNRNYKKVNSNKYISDEPKKKTPDFVINYYYEWADIPKITNLPYGLINRDKNKLLNSCIRYMNIHSKENQSNDPNKRNGVNMKCELLDTSDCVNIANAVDIDQNDMNMANDNVNPLNDDTLNTVNLESANPTNSNFKEAHDTYDMQGAIEFMENIIYEDILDYIHKLEKMGSKLKCTNDPFVASEVVKEDKKKKPYLCMNNSGSMSEEKTTLEKEESLDTGSNGELVQTCSNIIQNSFFRENEKETSWVKDFIILTNMQILAKYTKTFTEWEKVERILSYLINHCCSPRSCLCKKSFLTMKHLCISMQDNKINLCKYFLKTFPHIVRKIDSKNHFLDECSTKAIEEFMAHSSGVNNYEMLRMICSYSDNKNSCIIKKLSSFVFLFLNNLPKIDLMNLPISDFSESFLNFMNAKLEETKKFMKRTFALLLTIHNQDDLVKYILDGIQKKNNIFILEKQIRVFLQSSTSTISQPLEKKYATFHEFKNANSLGRAHKTSSFNL